MRSGKTQAQVAHELGISTVGLNQLVRSEDRIPKIETVVKIAAVVGVPVWKMLLSDEEIAQIRDGKGCSHGTNKLTCPYCGTPLKLVIDEEELPVKNLVRSIAEEKPTGA